MTLFGLNQDQLKLLKEKIQDVFGADSDLKVYIFGSRASGKNKKNSDIDLAFKSKSPDLNKRIQQLKNELEESNIPYKCDLVNWDEIINEYLPAVKKYKKLFWSKNDVILTSPWRICPIGYHWVREHLKDGNSDTTNPHCRRNPTRKDILKADEIDRISQMPIFFNPSITASKEDLDYKGLEHKYDHLINGWTAYWNDVFKLGEPLHPNHVKALIATESSFNANPPRNEKHTAIGLMQLMPKTISLLSIRSTELKDHYVEISKDEAFDPNINICAGIRWLFRKYELAKKRDKNVTWIKVIENYKGIRHQEGLKSNRIRSKFYEIFHKLNSR